MGGRTGSGDFKTHWWGIVGINVVPPSVPAPMAVFPFAGWKQCIFGDLHANGEDSAGFYSSAVRPTPNIPGLSVKTTEAIVEFCVRHHVRALRLFGSSVRKELTPESDIDILLEFQPGIDPDLFELGGMQQELSDLFDREVDLKTPDMFSPHNLQRILASSVLGYAA